MAILLFVLELLREAFKIKKFNSDPTEPLSNRIFHILSTLVIATTLVFALVTHHKLMEITLIHQSIKSELEEKLLSCTAKNNTSASSDSGTGIKVPGINAHTSQYFDLYSCTESWCQTTKGYR